MSLVSPTSGLQISGTRYPYYPTRTGSTTIILGLPVRREDLTVKPPETVTPAVAPVSTSWLDGEMIAGVKNTWLALGLGIGAAFLFNKR